MKMRPDDKSNIVFVGGLRKSTTEENQQSSNPILLSMSIEIAALVPKRLRTRLLAISRNLDRWIASLPF